MSNSNNCVICNYQADVSRDSSDIIRVDCPVCGHYSMSITTEAVLQQRDTKDEKTYVLSGVLRRASESHNPFYLNSQIDIKELIQSAIYPKHPIAAIDELLLVIYNRIHSAEEEVRFDLSTDYPLIFAKSFNEFVFILDKANQQGYIKNESSAYSVQLDIAGWERVLKLLANGQPHQKLAFMAMPFNNPELDRIYKDFVKSSIGLTGFDLKRVDESQPAGLIDSYLRVLIRNSRFIIADLTDNNQNVYWEAGFAEGLGKPVIYLCRKAGDEQSKTKFDTNHHTTVFYDLEHLSKAMEDIKSIVRATLPAEAKMFDEQ
ncbi:MAG: hypothetical protein ABSD46_08060 [Bacteroidota bacterium]